MKKTILLVLVLANGIVSISLAAEDTWTTRSPMPTATSLHSVGVVDGKIYVIGGTDNLFGWADYWSTVLVYDPATDTWTKKADMPTARARLSTSVVDGKIYAIGGSPHRDAEVAVVEVYDPVTDTWMKKPDMPRARNWHSSSVVNGMIYVIGGKIYPSETMISTVEEYDPETDTWTTKTDMPTARGMHSASVVDGKIYVIGGVTGSLGPWVSTVEVYDPSTDTWTKKADMPTSKTAHSSCALNGKIYVIGGANDWGSCLSMMEVYDPTTNTWARGLDMPTARGCHSTSVVNGKIYVIGGTLNPSAWMPTSTVEVYDTGLTTPPPDLNGDGLVDIKDLIRLIDSWGQDDPLVDIAPPPFGDDIVDTLDLELLMSYWGQPFDDPTLIAHWALDEIEGNFAYDCISGNDGICNGEPLWQPTLGMIDGALFFDGVDDYVSTPFILNPTEGPFSVVAWIYGGAPGQVIISQTGDFGGTFLGVNSSEGTIMTGFSGMYFGDLVSEAVTTDQQWHHVGFVYDLDSLHRLIYVDGVKVAEDTTVVSGMPSDGGLHIGASKDLDAGTFFSGLIDDVRIYNRVVRP